MITRRSFIRGLAGAVGACAMGVGAALPSVSQAKGVGDWKSPPAAENVLTIEKLLEARRVLMENDVDEGDRWVLVTAEQYAGLSLSLGLSAREKWRIQRRGVRSRARHDRAILEAFDRGEL